MQSIVTQDNVNSVFFIQIGLCYASYSEQAFTHTNTKDKRCNALQNNCVSFQE